MEAYLGPNFLQAQYHLQKFHTDPPVNQQFLSAESCKGWCGLYTRWKIESNQACELMQNLDLNEHADGVARPRLNASPKAPNTPEISCT